MYVRSNDEGGGALCAEEDLDNDTAPPLDWEMKGPERGAELDDDDDKKKEEGEEAGGCNAGEEANADTADTRRHKQRFSFHMKKIVKANVSGHRNS